MENDVISSRPTSKHCSLLLGTGALLVPIKEIFELNQLPFTRQITINVKQIIHPTTCREEVTDSNNTLAMSHQMATKQQFVHSSQQAIFVYFVTVVNY
jgi:hypothetical protein